MSIEMVTVRNLETGQVGTIRRDWFESTRINNGVLVEVEAGAKPYVAELYKSKLVVDEPGDETEEED